MFDIYTFPLIPKGIKNKISTELEKQKKKGSKKWK